VAIGGFDRGTTAFFLTLGLQQIVIFGRYGLRAAMIGSEVELHAACVPVGATSKSDTDADAVEHRPGVPEVRLGSRTFYGKTEGKRAERTRLVREPAQPVRSGVVSG